MIATAKPAPKLELLHGPAAAPTVDVDRVTVGEGVIVFPRGSTHGAELAWFLDPRSRRLVPARRFTTAGCGSSSTAAGRAATTQSTWQARAGGRR